MASKKKQSKKGGGKAEPQSLMSQSPAAASVTASTVCPSKKEEADLVAVAAYPPTPQKASAAATSNEDLKTPSTLLSKLTTVSSITPEKRRVSRKLHVSETEIKHDTVTKKAPFKSQTTCSEHVKRVYKIINKCTGSLGGNGSFGAIYGEATMGGMQRIVDLLKQHCEFDETCSFIDVGSGLGKPNFHVAQDPGCRLSFGVELEKIRNDLALNHLRHVLRFTKAATVQDNSTNDAPRHGNCYFKHGDITEATTFDPFTHVYTFDVGFPPSVLEEMAKIFNRSQAPYLICYHAPRYTIDRYKFNVELIAQYSVSLHGSGENHTGYIYRHVGKTLSKFNSDRVDPYFREGVELMAKADGGAALQAEIESAVTAQTSGGRMTRSRTKREVGAAGAN